MKFFNFQQNKKIGNLLKQSQQDFRFDQEKVKNKLLYSLRDASLRAPAPARTFFAFRQVVYSVSAAAVIIFLSATFTLAASSKPGDNLFALNKFREKVMLNLPLSMEQKANLHASIVSKRLEDLQTINEQTDGKQLETRKLETIKESDESIKDAVETVSTDKQKIESSGKTDKKGTSQKLDRVLNQIDDLAKRHEEQIKTLEQSVPDKKDKEVIDQHLDEIKKSRDKARTELKLKNEDKKDGDKNKKDSDNKGKKSGKD